MNTKIDDSQVRTTAKCGRCQRLLRIDPGRADSKPFRRAKTPKGLCPDCVVTEFLYSTYPVNMIIDERGPDLLRHPLMRQAFLPILANCEMNVDEIDWNRVADQWALPVNAGNGPKNPYRMGEATERRAAGWSRAGLYASEEDHDAALRAATANFVNVFKKRRGEELVSPDDIEVSDRYISVKRKPVGSSEE